MGSLGANKNSNVRQFMVPEGRVIYSDGTNGGVFTQKELDFLKKRQRLWF